MVDIRAFFGDEGANQPVSATVEEQKEPCEAKENTNPCSVGGEGENAIKIGQGIVREV